MEVEVVAGAGWQSQASKFICKIDLNFKFTSQEQSEKGNRINSSMTQGAGAECWPGIKVLLSPKPTPAVIQPRQRTLQPAHPAEAQPQGITK